MSDPTNPVDNEPGTPASQIDTPTNDDAPALVDAVFNNGDVEFISTDNVVFKITMGDYYCLTHARNLDLPTSPTKLPADSAAVHFALRLGMNKDLDPIFGHISNNLPNLSALARAAELCRKQGWRGAQSVASHYLCNRLDADNSLTAVMLYATHAQDVQLIKQCFSTHQARIIEREANNVPGRHLLHLLDGFLPSSLSFEYAKLFPKWALWLDGRLTSKASPAISINKMNTMRKDWGQIMTNLIKEGELE